MKGKSKTKEQLKALFDRSLFCVYIHDLEGNFLDVNDAALNLLGYIKEEIPLLSFSTFLDDDQVKKAFTLLEDVIKTGYQKNPAEFRLRKKMVIMYGLRPKHPSSSGRGNHMQFRDLHATSVSEKRLRGRSRKAKKNSG